MKITNARPNALTLAVAVAISYSIIATQALADRRLQTRSVDFSDHGREEFIQEVMVRPTLGHDQQPIPKSFTTSYPDPAEVRAGYEVASEGFTGILSGIKGGVASVDLFETDQNDVAQKYTKLLKVGNEGVFKFSHNLIENKLVIKVRETMTHQDSIAAVRAQLGDTEPIDELTKIASPECLAGVLKGAHERAGNLGEADHYIDLVTITVDPVDVKERTFMRLIAAGDQPPKPRRLWQSLFVNDEVLLAAAASAYAQVHILGKKLHQIALDDLLSYQKPVGYVVHIEDDRQAHLVPKGYPKLEVDQVSGERIVFRGQKQNPADVAFVETLYDLWRHESEIDDPPPETNTQVKKARVKGYQYVIRSRQMALLEAFAAEHNAGLNENGQTTLSYNYNLETLAYYEYLQQALTSTTSDGADEFELTIPLVRFVSSFITPTWLHIQLLQHFGFKPVIRNLLSDPHFVQNIHAVMPSVTKMLDGTFHDDESFASQAVADFTGKLLAVENVREKLQETQIRLAGEIEAFQRSTTRAWYLVEEKLKKEPISQHVVDQLKKTNQKLEEELEDINTPGHPKARPEVLATLNAIYKVFRITVSSKDNDLYLLRQYISENIQAYIKDAREWAEQEALEMLAGVEDALDVLAIEEEDKTARLAWILEMLSYPLPNYKLVDIQDEVDYSLWLHESRDLQRSDLKRIKLLAYLHHNLEEPDPDQPTREQIKLLEDVEEILDIPDEDREYAGRVAWVFKVMDHDDNVSQDTLDQINQSVWEEDSIVLNEKQLELKKLRVLISHKVEDSHLDRQAKEQQTRMLRALENILGIFNRGRDINQRIAAIENKLDREIARLGPKPRYASDREVSTGKRALAKAESELKGLYRKLNRLRKDVLFSGTRADLQRITDKEDSILNLILKDLQTELDLTAGDQQTTEERLESLIPFLRGYDAEKDKILEQLKAKNSLNIQIIEGDRSSLEDNNYFVFITGYKDNDGLDEDHSLEDSMGELPLAKLGYAQVTEFLHRHDRKTMAQAQPEEGNTLQDSANHEAFLKNTEQAMGLEPGADDTYEDRVNALRRAQVQLGGDDGHGGRIWQLTQKWNRLNTKIESKKANVGRIRKALKAAETAVKNDDGPHQLTPKQAKVRVAMEAFSQQHSLKQQALDAALGLAELDEINGKPIFVPVHPLRGFDFDDEFAPIRLQALAVDELTFNQASRMVAVFQGLKTTPFEPVEGQPPDALGEILLLVYQARSEIGKGTEHYDNEIHGMGQRAINFVEHEPKKPKSFPESFADRSASGNKIITLLREGLISKIELEHYIKAIRGISGYQTVAEFEYFLHGKHGVDLPGFKTAVKMLSDKSAEALMESIFTYATVTATGPAGMKESVVGMKEYATAVIANYVLDDIAFDNGRRTAALLSNAQDTLTPYVNAAGLSETALIKGIHVTLIQAYVAVYGRQLLYYWVKPSAFLVQAFTWYYSSYKPLLAIHTTMQASVRFLENMSLLYLLDLTHRGDYLHRMLIPFQHWLEHYRVDPERTEQYAYHNRIEQIAEVGGLAMPLGKAASSAILLQTGSALFTRQYNANPRMYRSISRLVPEMVKSMGCAQGVQIPLLHRVTPQTVKTLASVTAGLVLGPVATVGAYAHGLIFGLTYPQTLGFALASSLTFDFFMNDNKMLTQWLGGPLGRSLDGINRWWGLGETNYDYVKRTAVASPQGFNETDEAYADRVKVSNVIPGWTRHENYLQFRERRDHMMNLFENGWEKYFKENVPQLSFSHAESIPYFYTLGIFDKWQWGDDQKVHSDDEKNAPQSSFLLSSEAVK
ncbi:hypothetical protein [Endozoicomonas sp. 4G]|uniref:hypothetical protein n=1 Tax=Endozoicomonas sp. 4G TaxID=2872754 RepID=UPI00207862C5|nr:hypothetical protein [Endozoicomonas sp. 4G]